MADAWQQYLYEAQEGMRQSAALINEITEARTRKVPESHFRKYLLETVRAWVTRTGNPEIGYWLNVCDGLNREFHVVPDDDQETILFTVPAPFLDVDIPTTLPPNFTMEDRFHMLPHVVNRQGYIADNGDLKEFFLMEQQIIDSNAARPEKEAMAKALAHLSRMYQYYNLPLEELLGKEGAAEIYKHLGSAPTASSSAVTKVGPADKGISDDPDAYEF